MPTKTGYAKAYLGLPDPEDDLLEAYKKQLNPPKPPVTPTTGRQAAPPLQAGPPGGKSGLEAYSDPNKEPPFPPMKGKRWVRVRPYKIGTDLNRSSPTYGQDIMGYWEEEDLPDTDKALRTGLAQDRLDFDKTKAELDRARLEKKDAETIKELERRHELAKSSLALKEAEFQRKVDADKAKQELEASKFEASIDPTTGLRWSDIIAIQKAQDERAERSSDRSAVFAGREQALAREEKAFRDKQVEAAKTEREDQIMRNIYGPQWKNPERERNWWELLPGGGGLGERLTKQASILPSTPIDPGNVDLRMTTNPYAFMAAASGGEPLPEFTPAFQGAMNPAQLADWRSNIDLQRANARGMQPFWEQRAREEAEAKARPNYLEQAFQKRRSPARQR